MKNVLCPEYWGEEKPDEEQIRLSQAVLDAAIEAIGGPPYTGGCTTFYTPQKWKERKEEYGTTSQLIVVHDGGEFAPLLNLDYEAYALHDKFSEALRRRLPNYILEPCTCWYAALYKQD